MGGREGERGRQRDKGGKGRGERERQNEGGKEGGKEGGREQVRQGRREGGVREAVGVVSYRSQSWGGGQPEETLFTEAVSRHSRSYSHRSTGSPGEGG